MKLIFPIVLWLAYYLSGGDFSRDVVLGLFVLLTPLIVMLGACVDGMIKAAPHI